MQPIVGILPTQVDSSPAFKLGTYGTQNGSNDKIYVYGQARGAVTGAGYVCVAQTGFDFAMISVTETTAGTSGFGSVVGVAMAALADNEYGWFQVAGKGTVRTLASAAKGTRLNSTGTNGCLDDDGAVGSAAIFGIVLGTATGAAEANNSDAYLTFPTVGTTL